MQNLFILFQKKNKKKETILIIISILDIFISNYIRSVNDVI